MIYLSICRSADREIGKIGGTLTTRTINYPKTDRKIMSLSTLITYRDIFSHLNVLKSGYGFVDTRINVRRAIYLVK